MSACSVCTFVNNESVTSCEICGSQISSQLSLTPGSSSGWVCGACTFENDGLAANCVVCNTEKGDTHPICESCGVAFANIPFATCCRDCAIGQPCQCASKRMRSSSPSATIAVPPLPPTTNAPAAPKGFIAPLLSSLGLIGGKSNNIQSSSKSLTSTEMESLLSNAGTKMTEPLTPENKIDLEVIIQRIHGHVIDDRIQTAKAEETESFTWEWQNGNGSGRLWTELDKADQITVESERRRGQTTVSITSKTGERVTLDLNQKSAHFALSRRNVSLRSIPKSSTSSSTKKKINRSTPLNSGQCEVCFEHPAICASSICNHASACADCLAGFVKSRVETDPASWLPCPASDCEAPLDAEPLLAALTEDDSPWKFPVGFLSKQLVRIPEWVKCESLYPSSSTSSRGDGGGGNCLGGVLVSKKNEGKTVACPVCSHQIRAVRAVEEEDDEIKKMKADGTIRSCPSCRHPTMKERGVCNVICCEVCGIWWNWRSGETGKSSRDLKDRARARGTLWEPGELAYQQTLQQSDPEAFKALLERSGVQYDPNYRRGS